jgi:nitrite reductase (NADH) small subunit
MAFHTVCKVSEIHAGEGKTVKIDDVCPHMGASLGEGAVENGIVSCPWHAWRFRLADGAWADYPRVKIGCYPVRIEGEEVQVELGH